MTQRHEQLADLADAKRLKAASEAEKDRAILAALRRGTPIAEIRRALKTSDTRIEAVRAGAR